MINSKVGVVIIGRNEGDRLMACLKSLSNYLPQVMYVDSNSTDNSINLAKSYGAQVVALDMDLPFTAARARNTGFDKLILFYPHIQFIQFIDGDCMVDKNWVTTALNFLVANPNVAVVCGRRREKYPQNSIYNYLCDQEWNTPIGETKYCGGDALMRTEIVKLTGGYKSNLIAGEEPELCIRIRQAGFQIWRIDAEMTLHDAAMTRFSQWWKRSMRAGYAYAEGVYLHGKPPERHWVVESRRAWIWGFLIPMVIICLFFLEPVLSYILLLIYPFQVFRLTIKNKQNINSLIQAFFLTIGKFAEMAGQLKFFKTKYLNKKITLIEYK